MINGTKRQKSETHTANSVIDITLSDKLAVSVRNWTVKEGENFSDHNDINFDLETELISIEKTREWHKADWELFTDTLSQQSIPMRPIWNEKDSTAR